MSSKDDFLLRINAALIDKQYYLIKDAASKNFYKVCDSEILLVESTKGVLLFSYLHGDAVINHTENDALYKLWDTLPHDAFIYDKKSHIINWILFDHLGIHSTEIFFKGNHRIVMKQALNESFKNRLLDTVNKKR